MCFFTTTRCRRGSPRLKSRRGNQSDVRIPILHLRNCPLNISPTTFQRDRLNADPPAALAFYRLTAPRREAGAERRNCCRPRCHFSLGRYKKRVRSDARRNRLNADSPAPLAFYRLTAPRREAGAERRNCCRPRCHFSLGRYKKRVRSDARRNRLNADSPAPLASG